VIRFGHPHRGVLKKKMDDGGVLHGHNSEILPGVASSKSKCVKLKSIRPGCVRLPNAPLYNGKTRYTYAPLGPQYGAMQSLHYVQVNAVWPSMIEC